jgi:ABC-type multidrug transport system ATPase subunit
LSRLIQLENVRFQYPDAEKAVLDGVSLTVDSGETVRIIGRNGVGKSTLLKIISSELSPTSGRICEDDKLSKVYLNQFSGDMLAMDLTVGETAEAFSKSALVGREQHVYYELLQSFGVGLQERLSSFCGQLSGGQRQIIALAVSICSGTSLLCLDEFTSNLDTESEKTALNLIKKFSNDGGRSVCFVSHVDTGLESKVYDLGQIIS